MLKKYIILNSFIIGFVICFFSCSGKTTVSNKKSKKMNELKDYQSIDSSQMKQLGDRLFVLGDFNGDKINDTIFESYISLVDHKEAYKILNSFDFEDNLEQISKQKPCTRLYTNIDKIDTLIIETHPQNSGLLFVENIGDINEDGGDEFGFVISYEDYSNINKYFIYSIKKNKWIKVFDFEINERLNFYEGELLENGHILRKVEKNKIEYLTENDEGEIIKIEKQLF